MGNEDEVAKEKLTDFITKLKADLQLVVDHIDWFVEDGTLQEKVKAAWGKVKQNGRFDIALSGIKELTLDELRESGLTLEELELKKALHEKRSQEFNDFVQKNEKSGWTKRAWGYFKRLAGPVDIILGSLPIPGADAIGEVKDAVKDAGEAVE